jgi:PAS domain S-box-containing protein
MTAENAPSDLNQLYDLLGAPLQKEFDTITTLAAQACGMPVALLSFGDEKRRVFTARYGLNENETANLYTPFLSTLHEQQVPAVIADIRNEPLLVNHPFFESHHFLFYAGVPLIEASGLTVGILCVLDYNPSTLTDGRLNSLYRLADQAVSLMELRRRQQDINDNYRLLKEIEKKTELDKINYEALINNTSDDVWSIDTEFRLIAFNNAFSKKLEILTGKKVMRGQYALFPERIPSDLHLRFKSYFERALSGESIMEEYCRPENPDSGLDIWIELMGNPIYQNGVITGAAFFARTITERKRAELQTLKSEANYRTLFESCPLPIIVVNMESLQILEANRATFSKYGYAKDELLGKSLDILLREEDVCPFVNAIENLSGLGTETKLETIIHRKKDGKLIHGEMMLHELRFEKKNCFLAIINDQTEHLKSISFKTQMANILENSLNEIYVFETVDLRFLYVNRGAVLNIGYSLDELRQLTPFQIKPEFTETQFREFIAPLLSDHKEKLVFTTYHQRKDGSIYPVEVHLQKMWYEDQPALVAITIDITAAKASETKLDELNQMLEKSNHELEQFASITAHDLLEPLRMISGFTSLLERKYATKLDEKGLKYLRFASDGSVRMQQMIKDILEYSRATTNAKNVEPFNLQDVFKDVMHDLQLIIQSTGARIQLPQSEIILFGSQYAIYRLFLNLINNALKFIPEGKTPEICITIEQRSHDYQFTVSDNGIGIHPDHLKLLFKPYSRLNTRQKFEGTGLGLATCKKIVDYHGGSIWVNSKIDAGSQFHFTLPKNYI